MSSVGGGERAMPLYRRDLFQMGTVTSRSNLALMPPGKKGQVRVICADDSGQVASLQMVKGVPALSWRSAATTAKVEAVAIGPADAKDKHTIIYASGSTVYTCDKLGSPVSAFSTNSTEAVAFMGVAPGFVWTAGSSVVNLFSAEGKDLAYAMVPDRITSLCVSGVMRESHVEAVVGCADRAIRIYNGSDLQLTIPVDGPVTALAVAGAHSLHVPAAAAGDAACAPGTAAAAARYILYGTSNGVVGIVAVSEGRAHSLWSMASAPATAGAVAQLAYRTDATNFGADHAAKVASMLAAASTSAEAVGVAGTSAGITSITLGDVSHRKQCSDLIVAREDGSVEVYALEFEMAPLPLHVLGADGTGVTLAAGAALPAPAGAASTSSALAAAGGLSPGGTAHVFLPLPPRLLQAVRVEESVRSVAAGLLVPGRVDIIAQTFTGRVLCLSSDGLLERDERDAAGRSKAAVAHEAHVAALRKDVEELKKRIAKEREKLHKISAGGVPDLAASMLTAAGVPPGPDGGFPMARYDAISSFVLDPSDASYSLSVEVPAPIDCVVLQAAMPLELVDTMGVLEGSATSAGATGGAASASVSAAAASAPLGGDDAAASGSSGPSGSLAFKTSGVINAAHSCFRFLFGHPPSFTDAAESGAAISTLLSPPSKSTSAVISKTPGDARLGVATLATYRCQESSNRVQLRLRTLEGQHGELQALVVNRNLPKSATLLRVPVKPLSLHHRLAESNETIAAGLQAAWSAVVKSYAELASTAPPAGATSHASTALAVPPPATYPFGQLTVTGSFTLSQMHEWIAGSLPDAPARASTDGSEDVTLAFRNVFVGTHLLCTYRKGAATFTSDNPSTLAILKEVISNNATVLKARVSVTAEIPAYALRHILHLLHPKLHHMLTLQSKADLVEAVREMVTTDGGTDTSYLHPEFQDILTNADRYQRQLKHRGRLMETCLGVVTDAFVDAFRFHGVDVTAQIPKLGELLRMYHTAPGAVFACLDSGAA